MRLRLRLRLENRSARAEADSRWITFAGIRLACPRGSRPGPDTAARSSTDWRARGLSSRPAPRLSARRPPWQSARTSSQRQSMRLTSRGANVPVAQSYSTHRPSLARRLPKQLNGKPFGSACGVLSEMLAGHGFTAWHRQNVRTAVWWQEWSSLPGRPTEVLGLSPHGLDYGPGSKPDRPAMPPDCHAQPRTRSARGSVPRRGMGGGRIPRCDS